MKRALVEVENLTFGYGQEPVLRDIRFQVDAGDFVGIIGSNGAGKSTFLGLLLGELQPQGGSIRLFGQEAARFRNWPWIGYIPQNGAGLAMGFPANASEIVATSLYSQIGPLRLPGKAHRQKVQAALESVGMGDYAKRMIGEMSGGQLQRVLLARALVGDPKLIFLDEPVTGVDAQSAAALYEQLEALSARGIAIIMVTHDVQRAADYTQRMFCLEHGSMVELDSAQMAHELEHRHQHPQS